MVIDRTYILLVLPAVIFSLWANNRVNKTFQKYQNQQTIRQVTGAQAARMMLDTNGLKNVRIDQVSGNLTDHYDPTANVVRLSSSVYNSSTTAAVGVACHEVGHAIQYATDYTPVKIRTAIIPITNIGSKLATPLIIAGLLLSSFAYFFEYFLYAGIICFALCTFFQLITLPTEFNASNRALELIKSQGILYDSELRGAKEVLNAAAMTYVAALAVSLMQLIRFISIARRRSR